MSTLTEMQDRINKLTDPEMVDVAKELLVEMAELENMRQQIELRESKLFDGKRAGFHLFAAGLNPEELSHAANTAIGRARFLREKKERALLGVEVPVEAAPESDELGDGSETINRFASRFE